MMTLPQVFRVRQNFPSSPVSDLARTVAQELTRLRPRLTPSATVAIGAGSRGISNIAAIIRAVCDTLREFGARPFIVPAMGSHGGGTAANQLHLLAEYGITEATMGVPLKSSMEVVALGQTPAGVRVFLDRHAAEADFILPINRIKPHTDFKGDTESGLVKMAAVGLGKLAGAEEYHRQAFHLGYPRVFQEVAQAVNATGKLLGGLAILENALHQTAKIEAVASDNFIAGDQQLLCEAKALMPRIPCENIDLLIVDEMGKNISGAGLDTNIIGRSCQGYIVGVPTHENTPRIIRLLVCDLTAESNGNGVGIGLADFTTQRLMDKLDLGVTVLNVLTALTPFNAKLPICFANDRAAIEQALKSAGVADLTRGRVARIRNTLALGEVELSAAYWPEVQAQPHLTVLSTPAPMEFDAHGNLTPFDCD